jgi:hypothetical protein
MIVCETNVGARMTPEERLENFVELLVLIILLISLVLLRPSILRGLILLWTEPIVVLTFARVGQSGVGVRNFFEYLFGTFNKKVCVPSTLFLSG